MLICTIIFSLMLSLVQSQASLSPPLANFVNSKVIKEPGVYIVYWNFTDTSITVELHVKTNGWLGFGISPSGGMDGADVIVAWIDAQGNTQFTDRYIRGRAVLVDDRQDATLLHSERRDGYLIVRYTRNINTCDPSGQDIVIPDGNAKVIAAWNDYLPPSGQDIQYHGPNNRVPTSLHFLTTLNEIVNFSDSDNIEKTVFSVNATLPPIVTYYHCHMFKIPQDSINVKRHILQFKTDPQPTQDALHHWIAYSCDTSFNDNLIPDPGDCFSDQWLTVAPFCQQISLAWAVGGDLINSFPNGIAFPVGGPDREFTYFYLQMHYNNPSSASGIIDTSSIEIFTTTNYRPIEAGVFTIGADFGWTSIVIPPGQESFELSYQCRTNCLNNFYNGSNVTIFAATPHAHLTGIEIYTTQIRNGEEIAYISNEKYYDSNYQTLNFLRKSIVLQPGDELKTKCVYKTTSRTNYTIGGPSTHDEMCLDFLWYYPRRPNMGRCKSYPSISNWTDLIGYLVANNKATLSNPLNPDENSIAYDIQHSWSADDDTVRILKNFFATANQSQTCILGENAPETLNPPPNAKSMSNSFDSCAPSTTRPPATTVKTTTTGKKLTTRKTTTKKPTTTKRKTTTTKKKTTTKKTTTHKKSTTKKMASG